MVTGTHFMSMDRFFYTIENKTIAFLTALDSSKDSCLHTRLIFDRTSKSVTKIKSNEASDECAQWKGYPKTWTLGKR